MALPIANKRPLASTSATRFIFPATALIALVAQGGCASQPTTRRSALPTTRPIQPSARLLSPASTSRPTARSSATSQGTTSEPVAARSSATSRQATSRQVTSRQVTSRQATSRQATSRPQLAPIVRCAPPSSRQVALTFDDGPYRSRRQTERVLEILARKRVKATFFILGRLARRYPKLLQRIHREGHLLASHSWDHPKRQSRKGWISQLRRTEAAVRRAGVPLSRYYRPPHGIVNTLVRKICADLGYTIALYTLLSSDWRRPGVDALVRQVTTRLHRGGIVVLHDGGGDRRQTIAALPAIIDGLRKRGLEPVRMDRLLASGVKRRGCARRTR